MKASLSIKALLLSLASLGIATSVYTSEEPSKFLGIDEGVNISEEASQHINITKTGTVLSNAQFTIACVECSVIGDLSFSGGCNDTKPACVEQWAPDTNFSMLPFDFTEYWLGVAFDSFKVHIELNISLTPSQPSNEIAIPLLGSNGLDIPFMSEGIFATDFNFNPQIHGWVNSTSAASFTYGFDYVIPDHSAIFIPVLHLGNVSTFGLGNNTITPTNFTFSDPNPQFDFELSFRPIISLNANFLFDLFTDSLSFYADIPKLDLSVSQARNVTSNCEPPPAGTNASQIYKNLTHVAPSVSYDVDFSLTGVGEKLLGPFDATALATSCLDHSAKTTGPIAAPSANPASSGDRSVAVPMFGCLLVVTLVAVVMG